MADNVTAEAIVTSGQVFAADVIGSVAYVRNKITIGADGTSDGDVCATNPMPVTMIAGGVGATAAKQDTGNTSLVSIDTKTPSLGQALAAASVPIVLTAAQLTTLTPLASVAVTNVGVFAVQVSSALPAGTNAIGKLASNTGVTIGAVEIASAQTLAAVTSITNVVHVDDNSGSITVDAPVGTPAFVRLSDGSSAIATLPVSLASVPSHAVTNAGTFATQSACAGDVAHDGVDSGNPVKNGFKATTALSGLTLVANADRTDGFAGVDGVQIVRPHCNLEDVVQDRATNTDGASTAFAGGLATPGAGVRLWIKNVDIANSSSTMCTVDLRDGAAGAVLWTLPVPAGGVVKNFDPPLKLTANTALAYDASAATTTLTISANGFKSKV